MPYQFPDRLTGDTASDLQRLWEFLWKLAEQLNIDEEAMRAVLNAKEDKQ